MATPTIGTIGMLNNIKLLKVTSVALVEDSSASIDQLIENLNPLAYYTADGTEIALVLDGAWDADSLAEALQDDNGPISLAAGDQSTLTCVDAVSLTASAS